MQNLKDFRPSNLVSADSKGFTGPCRWRVSAHSKGVTAVADRQSTSAPPNGHEALIPGDFKSNEFVTGHSKEPTKPFFVRVHSKGLTQKGRSDSLCSEF